MFLHGLRTLRAKATNLTPIHLLHGRRVFLGLMTLQIMRGAAREATVAMRAAEHGSERIAVIVRHLQVIVRLFQPVLIDDMVHHRALEHKQTHALSAAEDALVALNDLTLAAR